MDAAAAYHALLEADPEGALRQAAELEAAFVRLGVTFDGVAMRSFLRPHFLARADWVRLRDDGRRLLELAARVARRAFDGDVERLFAFLGTPEDEARWVRLDAAGPDVVLSRLDAFLSPEGPRFIEINSDAPAGLGYGDRMATAFLALPCFQEFARRRRVTYHPSAGAVVEAVMNAAPPAARTVAIVDFAEVKTRGDQAILQEAFADRGLVCVLADPREMAVRGNALWAGEARVDVIYRRAVLSELLEQAEAVGPFLQAYERGLATFVNSFRCRLSEDKAFFALLTDEAFAPLLSAAERELVARCVPWTRRVGERRTWRAGREVDLLPHVAQHREEMVLKPAHGYGGREVLIGDETAPAEWERALQAACAEPWVVQERVAIPEEVFPTCASGTLAFSPFKLNVNPFYAAGLEVGAVARASQASVINVSAGGGSVPTFVVD